MATREPGLPAHQCHLIEGVFAYTVQVRGANPIMQVLCSRFTALRTQLLLFVVAMSALFFKRQFCDTTHRPVLVWALDCTKQVRVRRALALPALTASLLPWPRAAAP